MPPKDIHVLGVDPGGTTGWAVVTIPRICMFGDAPTSITDWYTGEIRGSESSQAWQIARLCRQVQSLAYKIGPAVICEGFDFGRPLADPEVYSPVRIGAMLVLLKEQTNMMSDAHLIFQGRGIAKKTMTDERLRAYNMYEERVGDHRRDAMRHAITALRRAKQKRSFRDRLWNPADCIA